MPHRYKDGEYEYASVTTIINDCIPKRALIQWAANCAADEAVTQPELDYDAIRFAYKKVSEASLIIGGEVHDAIQAYFESMLIARD